MGVKVDTKTRQGWNRNGICARNGCGSSTLNEAGVFAGVRLVDANLEYCRPCGREIYRANPCHPRRDPFRWEVGADSDG